MVSGIYHKLINHHQLEIGRESWNDIECNLYQTWHKEYHSTIQYIPKLIRTVLWCIALIITSIVTAFAESTWWRHQMETFSALLAICAGNSPVSGEFPTQRLVTRSFEVSFDLRLNKRLSKQSWGWWFETPSRPLWRHRNGLSHFLWYFVGTSVHCRHCQWCDCNPKSITFKLKIRIDMLKWNYPQLNATRSHWWHVKIGSGNGLVSSGNTPLSQPMFSRSVPPYDVTRPQWVKVKLILILVNEFTVLWCIYIHLQRHDI